MAAYVPTDCPTREKHAWLGDAMDVAEEALYNFGVAPMRVRPPSPRVRALARLAPCVSRPSLASFVSRSNHLPSEVCSSLLWQGALAADRDVRQ